TYGQPKSDACGDTSRADKALSPGAHRSHPAKPAGRRKNLLHFGKSEDVKYSTQSSASIPAPRRANESGWRSRRAILPGRLARRGPRMSGAAVRRIRKASGAARFVRRAQKVDPT